MKGTITFDGDEQYRTELLPAEPGKYTCIVGAPRTAVEAGEKPQRELPVLAWVVYWFDREGDYGHPMSVEPLVFWPPTSAELTTEQGWQSEWDFGCAVSMTGLNNGRSYDDRYKWTVVT